MGEMMGYNPETENKNESDIDKALEFTKNKLNQLRDDWAKEAGSPEKQKTIKLLIGRAANAQGVFSFFKAREREESERTGIASSLREHFKTRYEERMGDRQAAERKGDQQAIDTASEQIRALDDAAYFESISHS